MRKLLKYAYKTILPEKIRALLDVYPTIRDQKLPDNTLEERKILVLSPHPDDDIFGCGGTLHRYSLIKTDIMSVYMTDGRKGNAKYQEEDLVALRKKEAENAAGIIGIGRTIFLDNRDSELALSSKTLNDLADIFNAFKPDAVFIPFLLDNHPDHIETNKIFYEASKILPSFTCYAYCVWSPLTFFNLNVDITPYIQLKRRALEGHTSQLETYDYVDASLGLSKYYSALHDKTKKNSWSEVYVVCKSDEYRRLLELAYV